MAKRKSGSDDMTVGERMREFRTNCGLTQRQIAEILNINRTTYTKYETGVSEPSHEMMGSLVEIFGVDYNTLLGGSDYFDTMVADGGFTFSDLNPDERDLIAGFRTLSKEEQDKILEDVRTKAIENRIEIRKKNN